MNNADKPAYPTHDEAVGGIYTVDAGLTKREYFAAMALQGILANSAAQSYGNQSPMSDLGPKVHVQLSVAYADELLKQLEK